MKTNNGFWDSSALVPICVRQAASQDFRRLWRQSSRIIVWSGATVEIRSALARLRRNNEIDAKGLQFSLKRLEAMRRQWREIVTSDKLRAIAEDLTDSYSLWALDSFQLAAALVWCKEKPRERLFICDDARLSEAAEKNGFIINNTFAKRHLKIRNELNILVDLFCTKITNLPCSFQWRD